MINSSQKVVFHVFSRDAVGTSSAKKLRKQNKAIGNVFGLGKDSTSIYMDKQAVKKLYDTQGDTGLIYLTIGESKKQVPALITEYEVDPLSLEPMHVSFRRVDLSDPIEAEVPVILTGEVDIPDSVVTQVRDSITVEALPADLPEKIVIDISGLTEIGQTISLDAAKIDTSKAKFVLGEDEQPEDVMLVTVQEVKEEVEEEPEETVEGAEEAPQAANGESEAETSQEGDESAE